jgi:mono/diheme cytochrome c family protein
MWPASPVLIASENRLHWAGKSRLSVYQPQEEKMKSAVTILFLLLIGITVSAGAQGDQAEKGKALVDTKCALCHKDGGLGKPLAMLVGTNTDAFLKEAIVDPKKAIGPEVRMPAFKLTDQQVQDIIVYLRSIAKH